MIDTDEDVARGQVPVYVVMRGQVLHAAGYLRSYVNDFVEGKRFVVVLAFTLLSHPLE